MSPKGRRADEHIDPLRRAMASGYLAFCEEVARDGAQAKTLLSADQRVAIARALAPNPSVLLLDEPTSALDPELVNEVLEVIRRLAIDDGLTMIISTHQIRFADEVADRVAFLSGGAIIEEGPAHEVLSNPRNPLTARFLSVMEADKTPEAVR